jgi:hypothetical protein
MSKNITFVTGIWDLRRDSAGEGFKRPFQHYIDNFIKLLQADINMCVYIEKKYEDLVWQYRKKENTRVYIKEIDEFVHKFDFYDQVQKLRKDPQWSNQAEWLKNSTQATLELYNPMVMSKMFMLHDQSCFNPFNSDYLVWIDGGITNTVHPGYFTHDRVQDKLEQLLQKFLFLSFPYEGNNEIHGFDREGMNRYCDVEYVKYVCRGGFFGGHIDYIKQANGHYYGLLQQSLYEDYMGTEESIFTIMAHQRPEDYDRFILEDNGLIGMFFEHLKNDTVKTRITTTSKNKKNISNAKIALYVLTFNSPDQFEKLCISYLYHDKFITRTENYLIDNSTDLSTNEKYEALCNTYNFKRIKKDNIGICGGRQFAAEHFAETSCDYSIFLEDDMFIMPRTSEVCPLGFPRYTDNFYHKLIGIMNKENYDFLKFSFKEFFGDNSTQWAWYNLPQVKRQEYFPYKTRLPKLGLDPNAPKTVFKNIKSFQGVPYADGEIYYCNWPQIVSREGNQKMFLDVKWAHPYEQTWMSYIYQQTKENKIQSAILLMSPIEHDRFVHYDKELRREN